MNKVQKNADVEKVYEVFREYISKSHYLDWLWSDKAGYILLHIYPGTNSSHIDLENELISDAGKLCNSLFNEICLDVLGMTKNEHRIENADPLERAEIERRCRPYLDQLPEYGYAYQELFKRA